MPLFSFILILKVFIKVLITMKLKIATTQNTTAYQWEIREIWLPTEQGLLTVKQTNTPSVLKLIPGIVSFTDEKGSIQNISISKGIALISPNEINITVSTLTTSPLKKITELRNNQYLLELKLAKLKNSGDIESINMLIHQIEKVKADILLANS